MYHRMDELVKKRYAFFSAVTILCDRAILANAFTAFSALHKESEIQSQLQDPCYIIMWEHDEHESPAFSVPSQGAFLHEHAALSHLLHIIL
jgi:hypothetical protein